MFRAVLNRLLVLCCTLAPSAALAEDAPKMTSDPTHTYVRTSAGKDSLIFQRLRLSAGRHTERDLCWSNNNQTEKINRVMLEYGNETRIWREHFLWWSWVCIGIAEYQYEIFPYGKSEPIVHESPWKCLVKIPARNRRFFWEDASGVKTPVTFDKPQLSEAYIPPHQ